MKIKKGHLIGFFSTVIIFGIVFFYIYTGTMETSWIYNLENKTKTKLGKNIAKINYSENEEFLAYTTLNGTLKLCPTNNIDDIIITKKNINFHSFVTLNHKPNLIFITKEGDLYLYDFSETKDLNFNCYNEYVYEYQNKLYTISSNKITIYDFNENKTSNFSIKTNYDIKENIYENKNLLCIFSTNKVSIIDLINKTEKTIQIKDYNKNGIFSDNNIIYLNSKGEVVINGKTINIIPYYIRYKNKKVIFATVEKTYCYDTQGNELWSKDMMSSFFEINNKGDILATTYKNLCALYDINTEQEKFSFSGNRVSFSPSDKYLLVTEKSQF